MNIETLSKIKVGISSCLLGEKVRFDSGHKKNAYVTDTLNDYFEFIDINEAHAFNIHKPKMIHGDIARVLEPDDLGAGESARSKLEVSNATMKPNDCGESVAITRIRIAILRRLIKLPCRTMRVTQLPTTRCC